MISNQFFYILESNNELSIAHKNSIEALSIIALSA